MSDQLLEWIAVYGLSALFIAMLAGQAGIPLPSTLTLIVLGSLIAQGQLGFWPVVMAATAGAFLGDLIGYLIGRHGGRPLLNRFADKLGGEESIRKAEAFSRKWGGMGIFFSRWLVTPLGPWLNLTSGVSSYPWVHFAFWVLLGEALWILIYIMIGRAFSDQVEYVSDLVGGIVWVLVGLVIIAGLAWKLRGFFVEQTEEQQPSSRERR